MVDQYSILGPQMTKGHSGYHLFYWLAAVSKSVWGLLKIGIGALFGMVLRAPEGGSLCWRISYQQEDVWLPTIAEN